MDAYVEVEPGTGVSYDLLPVEQMIEIEIGSALVHTGSALRLQFSDPDTLARLAQVATAARYALTTGYRSPESVCARRLPDV
ncbi:hypothetical protein [Pseudonocardia sp. HH130630-07]|uniref:hypothetical protein n=1 Tax=Pseudonocardia sp. HH130630-07 TaxID=1690815 RepID=UPI0012EACC53|nr:hypothetical protein [Pseudonocardia sp. HH130630-07]